MQIILTCKHVHKFCPRETQLNSWNKRIHFPGGFSIATTGALARKAGRLGSAAAVDRSTCVLALVWLGTLRARQLCLRRKHLEAKYSKRPKQKREGLLDLVSELTHHHFHHVSWVTGGSSGGDSTPSLVGRNIR